MDKRRPRIRMIENSTGPQCVLAMMRTPRSPRRAVEPKNAVKHGNEWQSVKHDPVELKHGLLVRGLSQKTSGTALDHPRSLEPAAVLDLADIVGWESSFLI